MKHVSFQDTEEECTPSRLYLSYYYYYWLHVATIVLADGIISLYVSPFKTADGICIIIGSKLRLHVLLHDRDRAGRVVHDLFPEMHRSLLILVGVVDMDQHELITAPGKVG